MLLLLLLWLMMMFLFLLLFYFRHFPLKFFQNWVSNRWIVPFVFVVVVVIVFVVVVVHVVVLIVVVDPRNLPLKFGLNQVKKSWDIYDIEFAVVVGGGWCKVIFVSNPTFELSWGWGLFLLCCCCCCCGWWWCFCFCCCFILESFH